MKHLTLIIVPLFVLACADPSLPADPSPPVDPPVAATSSPVVGGKVDSSSKAVMGLGVGVGLLFFGHCTGTLIAPNLILTARHCVALTSNPGGGVICGKTPFTLQGPGSFFRATVETVRPKMDGPKFYKGIGNVFVDDSANDICGYDVALIMLAGAGVPSSVATPITPRLSQVAQKGEIISAVGYGLTQPNGKTSGTRMRIDGRKVFCYASGCVGSVKATELATDAPTCQGDSGGPALDSKGQVIGVLSRGPAGCTESVYGDVASNRKLIVKAAVAAANSGKYPLPAWARPYAPGQDAGPDRGVDSGAPDSGGATADSGTSGPDLTPDAADTPPAERGGCSLAPTGGWSWLLALALVALRRRRRA